MFNLHTKIDCEEIDKNLSVLADGVDLAVRCGDIIMLDEMEKRLNIIRNKYANDIIKQSQLVDKVLAIYRKLDNAKRQLVKFRRQREELNNCL